MESPHDIIRHALDILDLPTLVTKSDIRKQYRFLARKYHPDRGGDTAKMEKINEAYAILMKYIEDFRYTFDKDEVSRQFPGVDHADRFRP